jgi:hypothetical protein
MKTPMQELHHWVNTELKLDGYEHRVILDKIESMLEKEKEVFMDAYEAGSHTVWDEDTWMLVEKQEYYNGTFNTKQK